MMLMSVLESKMNNKSLPTQFKHNGKNNPVTIANGAPTRRPGEPWTYCLEACGKGVGGTVTLALDASPFRKIFIWAAWQHILHVGLASSKPLPLWAPRLLASRHTWFLWSGEVSDPAIIPYNSLGNSFSALHIVGYSPLAARLTSSFVGGYKLS